MSNLDIVEKWCLISNYQKNYLLKNIKILPKKIIDKMLDQIYEYECFEFYASHEDFEEFICVEVKRLEDEVYNFEKQQKLLSQVMSQLGKQSGKNMTPEQRKERAKKAIQARWSKRQNKQQDKLVIHSDK